ncbi:sex hormone-binding globulin isoform X2 [Brienomyrus brachyistius]|uniref:sex hormone-binding globulin isoform X2 n=1 Tax=Brienomyrus brachyistius TaxID=42636 RepID=UPI0020B226D7|nr:sex hormone-binding globulin isoform X2 [Brienomyrus brachyistius]XP_048883577.1 sex hormone-binding globulin isoform X2 [Brienomyrus brachyistius]
MDPQPLLLPLLLLCVSLAQRTRDTAEGPALRGRLISGNGPLDLGQRWGLKTPLMHMKANLTEVTSIRSTFEFRTLDPEGLVLYGDTQAGAEWFVLGLRDGVPEMQIRKRGMIVAVTGGPRLNNGHWHQVQLRNEGQSVVLEVNGSQALVLGLHSQHAEQDTMGLIRLSLGGILVKDLELFNSLRLEMDGCVRAGNWLNLSQPWATELVGEPRTCFTHIRRGSFFPGTGLAVFNTSDFPTHQGTGRSITIEMEGHIGNWTGTVLAILNSQHKAILTIAAQNQTQKLEVTFGERTDSLSLAQNELLLNLSENVMQIALGNKVIAELRDDARDWLNIWDDGMLLAFGGVPDYSTNTSDSQYLHGCIWGIRIQDRELDLDHALYKHSSISSHSCPASPDLLESSALLTADR